MVNDHSEQCFIFIEDDHSDPSQALRWSLLPSVWVEAGTKNPVDVEMLLWLCTAVYYTGTLDLCLHASCNRSWNWNAPTV